MASSWCEFNYISALGEGFVTFRPQQWILRKFHPSGGLKIHGITDLARILRTDILCDNFWGIFEGILGYVWRVFGVFLEGMLEYYWRVFGGIFGGYLRVI